MKASPVAWTLQFLIKKRNKKISAEIIFLQFLVIKTLHPDSLEMLDPDSYPDSINPDLQLCHKPQRRTSRLQEKPPAL
jgi:hypothetical protein